ncbi:pyridoxamine 5'-phosphate oxidase family protein [Pedobacter sp. SYSU D00535]|uniref:pyridoxamine 5'-phosphate oxidase family protein n=1 Tax=Pedobacter sp. SYSU D00535 TaxID=2810308 RepID=UPI001A970E58|nr:pyridoxamine 5'-phosphate oxidase family protein [Pedobacter sp. SYSU D00535]
MDSINKQQPEKNRANLFSGEAAEKIKELAKKAKTCFFCTEITDGKPFAARPMSAQLVDDEGNVWFLSAEDSHKNMQLHNDPYVQLLFQGSENSDFMSLYGRASVSKDKEKIKELWNPLVKTWFTEGIDDPRITVIKVQPEDGYYWDTKHGTVVAFAKMVVGAIAGKTLDDSIEGRLQP